MAHRFNGGKGGFTCDNRGCKGPMIYDWAHACLIGPTYGAQKKTYEKTGKWPEKPKRREYCSFACLEAAEAGTFVLIPHHPACLPVSFFRVRPRSGLPFEPQTVMKCVDGCPQKEGPPRYQRIEKAKTNEERRKRRSEPARACSSVG